MFWRTRFNVDPRSADRIGFDLQDPYRAHQFILMVVEEPFMFSLKTLPDGMQEFLLQSRQQLAMKRPDLVSRLKQDSFKRWLPGTYDFAIRANSAIQRRDSRGRQVRIPRSNDASIEWLCDEVAMRGAEITRYSEHRSFPVTVASQNYDVNVFQARGELRVEDPETFQSALVDGIGRGRHLGYGMMILS